MIRGAKKSRGFTLIELLIVVAIISMASAMAIPIYDRALEKTHRSAIQADCYTLYHGMMSYHFDNDKFPSEAELNLATLAPLSTGGYFNGAPSLVDKLAGGKFVVYLAPDVNGSDTQFVLVGRSRIESDAIFAVVYTNVVTDDRTWVDGVYTITPDDLAEAKDVLRPDAESVPSTELR